MNKFWLNFVSKVLNKLKLSFIRTFQRAEYYFYRKNLKGNSLIFGSTLSGDYINEPIRSIIVFEYGRNPSTDYYVQNHLKAKYQLPVNLVDISNNKKRDWDELIPQDSLIVIVRYVDSELLENLHKFRSKLRGVVYFLDDDLLSVLDCPELPDEYKRKIFRLFVVHRRALAGLCSEFWVSSQYLLDKYRKDLPVLVNPMPENDCAGHVESVLIFYHGTKSHWREILWLYPIIEYIQNRRDDTYFEIIGDHQVYQLFRNIPRTTVLHPMSWENYLAYCKTHPQDIGLVPLLDSPFNAARSHTKVFDILRCGAVGIYSDRPPYNGIIKHGETGLLIGLESEQWIEAIERLANDRRYLDQLKMECLKRFSRDIKNEPDMRDGGGFSIEKQVEVH